MKVNKPERCPRCGSVDAVLMIRDAYSDRDSSGPCSMEDYDPFHQWAVDLYSKKPDSFHNTPAPGEPRD